MSRLVDRRFFTLIAAIAIVGCAAPAVPASGPGSASVEPRPEKRIVFATPFPVDIRPTVSVGTRQTILPLIGSPISTLDGEGHRVPILAEQMPSLDNGLWTLGSDGTMETTIHLRPGLWHDGTPITADDFVFSIQVGKQGVGAVLGSPAYAAITEAVAADARTLVIRWKEPFNMADALFSWDQGYGAPLPKHLLAEPYIANPDGLLDLPYWVQDYIGTGPFKVVTWDPGTSMQVVAHDGYALGRPKLDRIDIQLLPDHNTLIAGLLAGTIDAASNLGSADAAKQLSEQWQEGQVLFDVGSGTIAALLPQFLDPDPAAIADVRFRRALATGVDRKAIVDEIILGFSPVPTSFLSPGQTQYAALEASLPRYDYDPQRAAQGLADLGYVKGTDGTLREPSGRPLSIEVRSAVTGSAQQQARAAAAIADGWHRLGVAATPFPVPLERTADPEYTSTFPGFYVIMRMADENGIINFASDHSPTKANNYRAPTPQNFGRYSDAEMDKLIAGYFRIIPLAPRAEAIAQIVQPLMEQVAFLPLWYNVGFGARNNRMSGVGPQWPSANFAWNAYGWDISR